MILLVTFQKRRNIPSEEKNVGEGHHRLRRKGHRRRQPRFQAFPLGTGSAEQVAAARPVCR